MSNYNHENAKKLLQNLPSDLQHSIRDAISKKCDLYKNLDFPDIVQEEAQKIMYSHDYFNQLNNTYSEKIAIIAEVFAEVLLQNNDHCFDMILTNLISGINRMESDEISSVIHELGELYDTEI